MFPLLAVVCGYYSVIMVQYLNVEHHLSYGEKENKQAKGSRKEKETFIVKRKRLLLKVIVCF
jgi:hypothetical protein